MPKVKCEHCEATLNVEERKLGKIVKCPKCGKPTKLVSLLGDVLRQLNFSDPVDEPNVVEFYEDEISTPRAPEAATVAIRKTPIASKQDYREQYSVIGGYVVATQYFGMLLLVAGVACLAVAFIEGDVKVWLALTGLSALLIGFWFFVSAAILDGFINICASTERTEDILEARL